MSIEINSAEIIDTQDGVQKFLRSLAEESTEGHDTHVKDVGDGQLTLSKSTGLSCRSFAIDAAALRTAVEQSGLPWEEGYEDRVIPWWASDQRVDRHGDIVEQSWDFSEFDNNPVVLYGHNWEAPPIGNVIGREIKNRRDKDYSGPALRLMPLFATKEQYPAADVIFRLAKARFLRTGSVGFMPGEIIRVDDKDEREKLGLGNRGVVYKNNSLLEWTICSVPANSGAHQVLATAKSKGLLKSDDINVIRELRRRECLGDESPEKSWLDSDNILCSTWYSIFPEIRINCHSDIEKPVLSDESFSSRRSVCVEGIKAEAEEEGLINENVDQEEIATPERNTEVMVQLMAASITRQDRLIERIDTLIEITSDLRETVESENNVDFSVEGNEESTVLSSALEQCLRMMDGSASRNT